jgi:hypothetical protein
MMDARPAAREAAARVAAWLLQGPAVVLRGPDAGGVIGRVAAGEVPFVYPEICGYHLSWLASLARMDPARAPAAGRAAAGVASWLEEHDRVHDRFVTRVHGVPLDDWRNCVEFTFDLGMILRGLDAAAAVFPGQALPRLRGRCVSRILATVGSEGVLGSHRAVPGASGDALPQRWSTTPGPHLIKVAAALVREPDATAAAVGRATIRHHLVALEAGAPLPPPHPALYAVEGLLQGGEAAGEAAWSDGAAVLWLRVLDAATASGALPAAGRPPAEGARIDVLAQALRAGRFLAGAGALPGAAAARLDWLERCLVAAIGPDGATPFHYAARSRPRQDITWGAHFAHQALTLGDAPGRVRWLV